MNLNNYVTGVNYLASNAGIKMWLDFDPEVIDKDFEHLKKLKIDVIRIFPLWSVFQPIHQIYECKGKEQMLGFKGDRLFPDTYEGRAGLDVEMLDKFEIVLDLAHKHGLKAYIGILSGWLSGRLFCPPALEGRNLTSDPLALKLEMDFIRVFVERFRDKPAVAGWASGNETDCLSDVDWDERLAWQAMMRNAIKAADPNHPVLNDMHPLRRYGIHTVAKRRDLFDLATIHPYSYFTPYSLNEPVDGMRNLLLSSCEATVYGSVLRIPCLMEETGTVGEFVCNREITANYAKTSLFTGWADGACGMIWWCGFDFWHLDYPPYSKDPLERELGLLETDRSEKPAAVAFREFKETIEALPFKITPPKSNAVCILSNQDEFAIPLGAYVLAKQAGMHITFAHESSIPKSDIYLIPTMYNGVDGRIFSKLLKAVEEGATLYMSYDNWVNISQCEQLTGNELIRNFFRGEPLITEGGEKYKVDVKLELNPTKSTVLLKERDGNPILTEFKYGKGHVLFSAIPTEKIYGEAHTSDLPDLLKIYIAIAKHADLAVTKTAKELSVTDHTLENGQRIIVIVNCSNKAIEDTLTYNGVSCKKVYVGNVEGDKLTIEPHGVAIFEIQQ